MWNWELQRGPSQNVQCSVTRISLHHHSGCWGAAHRLSRAALAHGFVGVFRVHPCLLNSLILGDLQGKADLGSKATPCGPQAGPLKQMWFSAFGHKPMTLAEASWRLGI